mgnify:FL=1
MLLTFKKNETASPVEVVVLISAVRVQYERPHEEMLTTVDPSGSSIVTNTEFGQGSTITE